MSKGAVVVLLWAHSATPERAAAAMISKETAQCLVSWIVQRSESWVLQFRRIIAPFACSGGVLSGVQALWHLVEKWRNRICYTGSLAG